MSPPATVPGTEGYADQAASLVGPYEALAFEEVHREELHLLPDSAARILDVGAGTGHDAAWLAARGHEVLAVELVAAFRAAAARLHPSPAIEWLEDALPDLERVHARGQAFDAILLTAVWMHLDEPQRRAGMGRLAALLAPAGVLVMSLRHGPVPAGRRMFEVSGEETIALARTRGLEPVLHARTASVQAANRAAGVTWTKLAFRRRDA